MAGVIGLDVGGANTKAVRRDGDETRALTRVHEVWNDRAALEAVILEVVEELSAAPGEPVALTTTAELSDAFRTKRDGVAFVLDAAEAALAGRPVSSSPRPWRASARTRSRPPTGWRARWPWPHCTPTR